MKYLGRETVYLIRKYNPVIVQRQANTSAQQCSSSASSSQRTGKLLRRDPSWEVTDIYYIILYAANNKYLLFLVNKFISLNIPVFVGGAYERSK